MTDEIFEETLDEVAVDLRIEKDYLRGRFVEWLNNPDPKESHKYNVACYAIYRITKLKHACRMGRRSRENWRNRAMELGSPDNLVEDIAIPLPDNGSL